MRQVPWKRITKLKAALCLGILLMFLAAPTAVVALSGIDQVNSRYCRVSPLSCEIKNFQPQRNIELPPLDRITLANLRAEDEINDIRDNSTIPAEESKSSWIPFKGKIYLVPVFRVRVSVVRNLDIPLEVNTDTVPATDWLITPSGLKIFCIRIKSSGARAIGTNIKFNFPKGVHIVVYSHEQPNNGFWLIHSESPFKDSFPACGLPGDTAIVECQVPQNIDTRLVEFSIKQVIHDYRSLGRLSDYSIK